MPVKPSPIDIIKLLESYDLETTKTISSEVVTADYVTSRLTVGGGLSYEDGNMVVLAGADTPLPLVAGVTYYAIIDDPLHIKVALSYVNAMAGIPIILNDNGTGTITLSKKDYYFCSVQWIADRLDNFIIPTIEKWTGFAIGRTEQHVEYHSGQGNGLMFLNYKPIVSLDEIRYVLSGAYTWVITKDAIEVIPDLGIIKARRSIETNPNIYPLFAKGDMNIKVTYTTGAVDIPKDLVEAMKYFAAEQILGMIGNRTGGGGVGLQVSKSFGNRSMYTEIRNDLARWGHSLVKSYTTSIVGA